ncbi:MAG TPA: hypothetical protein VMH90_03560, partial [Thermoplasmata archaeon]|nr:hypothetical protein [Thermoplasmata archaeon]
MVLGSHAPGPTVLERATSELQGAQRSLAAGQGPGHGVPLDCRPGTDAASWVCGSTPRAQGDSAGPGNASNSGWTNLTGNLSPSPQPLSWGSMTYDSEDGYVLLFGGAIFNATSALTNGIITSGNVSSQTWRFQNGSWTDLTSTVGTPPPPREEAMMVDDPSDGYVLLFGGTYSELCSNGANGTVPEHPAGANCSEYPGPFFYSFYPNDSWAFRAGTWSRLHPSESPAGRALGQMAYDPRDGYVVLFGGLSGQGMTLTLGDTWTFSRGNWTDLTGTLPEAPPPRGMGGLAWDASDGFLLLFGGATYISTPPWTSGLPWEGFRNDTWTFVGGAWSNISSTLPLAPGPRANFEMDSGPRGGVLLFAGATVLGSFGDTWLFHDLRWWYLSPSLSTAPPSLEYAMTAFVPAQNTTLLFGGDGGTQLRCGPGFCENVQNYTWVFGPSAPDGFDNFSFPELTLTATPASGWAPLNVSIGVRADGGRAPYRLALA